MTNRETPMSFLRKLLESMKARGVEVEEYQVQPDGTLKRIDGGEINYSRIIHDDMDLGVVKALDQWMVSQGLTKGQVQAALAFSLAHEIYHNTEDEFQACEVAITYEKYIHQSVHLMHKHYGPPPKKSDDVEK